MTLLEQMRRIHCISEFDPRPIEDEILQSVVSAAEAAPSAADTQPWELIAVREPERKLTLAGMLLDSHLRPSTGGDARRHWLGKAPLVLVLCLDHTRAKVRFGEIGERLFGPQDTGAALQNIRLAALEVGIKSCLVREFDHTRVAELLELPRHVEPVVLVAMGYSKFESAPRPHLLLEDYLHLERW